MKESKNLKKALLRPKEYEKLCYRDQWDIDRTLGILDWKPTSEEIKLYKKLRKNEKT